MRMPDTAGMRHGGQCFARRIFRFDAIKPVRSLCHILVHLLLVAFALSVSAQRSTPFGHTDDLRERLQREWWRRDETVMAAGGLSLIGAQWRGAGGITLELVTRAATARISGTLRAGPLGDYGPDLDEWYDLLRLVEFARLNTREGHPLHVRVGLLDGMQLGTGHVVNFFGSAVSWDERTVGAEFRWAGKAAELAAFSDNIFLDGIVGGRLALRPLGGLPSLFAGSVTLGLNYVTDRAGSLEGYNVDFQFDLFESGDIYFAPFASYAWYTNYGDGLAFGADLYSDGFLDLLRFRLRVAAFYNSRRFIPGYVGSFYTVSNLSSRILQSTNEVLLAGVTLDESRGASDLLTEFRLALYRDFSVWYYYRQHFGGQRLSEFHLRLFLRTSDALRVELGIDRGGLGNLLTVIGDFGDLSALVFGTQYQLAGPLYLYVTARYSFERRANLRPPRFLVQRRFEPMTGLRLQF